MLDANGNRMSVRGRLWERPEVDPAAVRALRDAGAPGRMAEILAARGMDPSGFAEFHTPTLRALMPDPSRFQDMDRAATRIADAIIRSESFGIWSDYDVDGATSAAILGWFFRLIGRPVPMLRIPDRFREGYGPNAPGLLEMRRAGIEIVAILDAGTVAFEPLAAARDAGLDVVVIDHHAAGETLPPACAVVNPNRRDEAPGFGHLCAAGMTFITCVAVARELRNRCWFDGRDGRPGAPPDLMSLLDLVALGTVCDVVPLTGLNRAFTIQGLKALNDGRRPGVAALAEVAGRGEDVRITAEDLGWRLGPRINAGGRVGDAGQGAALLLEDDPERAMVLALELERCNRERRGLEEQATKAALEALTPWTPGVDRRAAIAVVDAHEGVVGISASRVKEACDAPAFVLTRDAEGRLKGSARSVEGFDLGAALLAAAAEGLLVKGGGHAMAGGLTLDPGRLEEVRAFLDARIEGSAYAACGVISRADLACRAGDLTVEAVTEMEMLAPFGAANPEPCILLSGVLVEDLRILKDVHVKCSLSDGRDRIDAIAWNAVGTPLGDMLEAAGRSPLDVLGTVSLNRWNGAVKVQLVLSDLRPAMLDLVSS